MSTDGNTLLNPLRLPKPISNRSTITCLAATGQEGFDQHEKILVAGSQRCSLA
jgi:hypothetical protein